MKKDKPSYFGHRKRIKEKYIKSGFSDWLDYEKLEFILFYAIPRRDTKSIAKRLLSKFKTINGVLDADIKELKKIKGISDHTALFLKFLKDISILYLEKGLYKKDLLSSPEVVYNYLKASLKGSVDEEFKTLFLDNRNHLITEKILTGTVNKCIVYPRKIVELALNNHAAGVIIAHNHPAGSLNPSEEDLAITKDIKEALKTVDIALLDHIIIGENNYFSFKENNLI